MITFDILHADSCKINLLEEAFLFGLKELMPRKKNLDVTITLCDTGDSACGWHICTDKNVHEIEINPDLNTEDMLTCLWHEMVHVRQAERGIEDSDEIPYYEKPTEIEAYKLQEELLEKWNK
jgi:hypothetical protein